MLVCPRSEFIKDIQSNNCPMRLWDYCAECMEKIHKVTPRNVFQLNGNTPTVATHGAQGDISNMCQFGWYNWCYFQEEGKVGFIFQKQQLGRVLRPMKDEGNEMTQTVLKINRRVATDEMHSDSEKSIRKAFDYSINKIHGGPMSLLEKIPDPDSMSLSDLDDEDKDPVEIPDDDPVDATGKAIYEKLFTDMMIHAKVLLPQRENVKSTKVQGITKDDDGKMVGTFESNQIFNTIIYDVDFPDGAVKQYAANVIAENMYIQVDSDGHSTIIFDVIAD